MTDRQGKDPLRRRPPTIDLSAAEVRKIGAKGADAPASGPPGPDAPKAPAGAAPAKADATPKPAVAEETPKPAVVEETPKPAVAEKPVGPVITEEPLKAAVADAKPGPADPGRPGEAGEPVAEGASAIEPLAAASLDGAADAKGIEAGASPGGGEPGASVPPPRESVAEVERPSPPPEPAPLTPAPPARGPGIGSLLAASVVGGLIGAGALYGVQTYGRGPDDRSERLAALERRVGTLGQPAAPGQGLDRRVADLEAARADLARAVAEAKGAADAARQASGSGPAPGGAAPDASAPRPDPALQAAVAALGPRLDKLDEEGRKAADDGRKAAEEGRKASEAASAALAGLRESSETADRRLSERLEATAVGLRALQAGTAPLQASVQDLQTSASATAGGLRTLGGSVEALQAEGRTVQGRLADQGKRLDTVAAELARLSPAAVQAGLRTVVAGRLDEALRTGAPLGPSVTTLERLGSDPAALAALKPFVTTAPPSSAALAAEFAPLVEKMTQEPRPAAATLGDRLLRVADKIVTVRALGDGSGTDMPGLVARIESSLARSAPADALRAWEALPPAAKSASAAWAEKLKSRVAVEEAARAIGAAALASLDAATR